MNRTITRRIAVAAAAAGAVIAGAASLGSTALATQAQPDAGNVAARGFSPVQTCTSLTGSVHLQPGLRIRARQQTAVLTGTLDGCSFTGGDEPGQGTFSAVLSGSASNRAGTLSGTFTANWPASSGLNPSNGTLSVSNTERGVYTLGGRVTSGASTGAVLRGGYLVTTTKGNGTRLHPTTVQRYVNTASLQLLQNFG